MSVFRKGSGPLENIRFVQLQVMIGEGQTPFETRSTCCCHPDIRLQKIRCRFFRLWLEIAEPMSCTRS